MNVVENHRLLIGETPLADYGQAQGSGYRGRYKKMACGVTLPSMRVVTNGIDR